MAELQGQIADYLESVRPRYAESSLAIYHNGLQRFEAYAAETGIESVAEVTETILRAYHSWLWNFSLSESTIGLGVRSVKLFLRWAAGNALCFYDGDSYSMKEPRSRVPEPPSVAVMARLFELANRQTPEGLRDLLCLELLYGLGLRRTEATRLDLPALDLNEESLFVVGKNGDERLLPVGLKLKQSAQAYLMNARPRLLTRPNEKALLLSDDGQRLSGNALRYIVMKYGDRLDLKLTTHQLRHACATHLIEAGMKLHDVQRLLGHRDINSTKRYAQITERELQREFHRSHPRRRRD